MSRLGGPQALLQQHEAIAEPGQEPGNSELLHAAGRQLYSQRQAVELPAELGGERHIMVCQPEIIKIRLGAFHEELDRGRAEHSIHIEIGGLLRHRERR